MHIRRADPGALDFRHAPPPLIILRRPKDAFRAKVWSAIIIGCALWCALCLAALAAVTGLLRLG